VPLVFSLSAVASISQPGAGREWQAFNLDCTARAHRRWQHRTGGCHCHMVPDLQDQRLESAGECGGSFAAPTATRHKNARRLESANPSIADYLHRFGRYGIPFDVVYGPGAATGRSPSRAAYHECPLACDRSSFSPGLQSQICGVRPLIPAVMMCPRRLSACSESSTTPGYSRRGAADH
jgi:hypothetical protein